MSSILEDSLSRVVEFLNSDHDQKTKERIAQKFIDCSARIENKDPEFLKTLKLCETTISDKNICKDLF